LPEHRVRVIAPDVGGSFGIKIDVYQDDLAAVALALTLGRPVKFVATRHESFLSDIHAREQTVAVEVAATADGTLLAMSGSITAAVGPYSAFPRSSVVEGGQVLRLLPGPYRLSDYRASLRVVAQNKVITSQCRAVGHPIATAVSESMIDVIARDLGLDPADVRRRNLLSADELPYTSAAGNVYDSGSFQESFERLLDVAKYAELRREQAAARAARRHVGIGLARFLELTGPGARRQDQAHSSRAAGSSRQRHRAAERPRRGAGHRLRPRSPRPRPRRALPIQRAPRPRAERGRHRPLHQSEGVDLHQRRAPRRGRRRRGDGARAAAALRDRGRLRPHREPRARRRPDRGRRHAGPRWRVDGA